MRGYRRPCRDELLVIDSGVCGYEMPEYQEYYHTTRAHNAILVGGEGQIKRLPGKIAEQTGVPGLSFVLGDATAPYEGRLRQFLRGVLFVGGEYYVVVDWLRKQTDAPFGWLLHYDGEMAQESEGYLIRKGKASLLVKMVEPVQRHLVVGEGFKTYHEDLALVKSTQEKQKEMERGEYLEITPAENRRQQNFLTVLYPFAQGGARPTVEELRGKGWIAVQVVRSEERDLIGLRRPGARKGTGVEGIETDGRLFCITWDGQRRPVKAFMQAGTYLKANGALLISSPQPATLAAQL